MQVTHNPKPAHTDTQTSSLFQLLSVTVQEVQARMSARVLLQLTGVSVHPHLHEAGLELTNHRPAHLGRANRRPAHPGTDPSQTKTPWDGPTTDRHIVGRTNHRQAHCGTDQSHGGSARAPLSGLELQEKSPPSFVFFVQRPD